MVGLTINGILDLIKYRILLALQIMRLKFREIGFSRSHGYVVVYAGGGALEKLGQCKSHSTPGQSVVPALREFYF